MTANDDTASWASRWARALVAGTVEREQLVAMIRATPWGWSLGVLGIVILHEHYGRGADAGAVAGWLPVICGVVALRLGAWLLWLMRPHGRDVGLGWALVILGSNLAFAACWGGLCLLLGESASVASEGVLHVTLAAVAMGGASRLAGFDRVMAAFVALVLAPLAVRDFWIGTGFGVLTVVTCLYAMLSGLSLTRALRDVQSERERNAELAARLKEEVRRGEAARLQLEEEGRARTYIFAAANHDLRQPLHAMGLLVQALRSLPASDEVRSLGERLEGCTEGMGDVVDDLIELTRAYAEPRQPRLAPLALQPLIEDCCRPYAALAAAKGLRLEVAVPDVGVLSDASMLTRIVANLVSNAVRYTHSGTVKVEAERERSGGIHLHIQDSGIGIAAEHLARIFEPFYQVGNPGRDRRKGLGLGLATVQRFAAQLNIDVSVSSVPGEGTRFTLRLNRCDPPARLPEMAGGGDAAPFAGRRVLAVEDDPAIADALQRLLQTWGCEVAVATDGDEALALAERSAPPDAVIADLALPGSLSGADVAQRLLQRWGPSVPVLFMTGSTEGPVAEAARASGLPLLVKPVAPARLRAFLAQAFSVGRP